MKIIHSFVPLLCPWDLCQEDLYVAIDSPPKSEQDQNVIQVVVSNIADPFTLTGPSKSFSLSEEVLLDPLDYHSLQKFSLAQSGITSITTQQMEGADMHVVCRDNASNPFATFTQSIGRSPNRTWLSKAPQLWTGKEDFADPLFKFAFLRCSALLAKWAATFNASPNSQIPIVWNSALIKVNRYFQ